MDAFSKIIYTFIAAYHNDEELSEGDAKFLSKSLALVEDPSLGSTYYSKCTSRL
jgi:hypothetical protein